MHALVRATFAVVSAVVLSSCAESPAGPFQPGPLSFDTPVEGFVAAGDTVVYRFALEAGQQFSVYVDRADGGVDARVIAPSGEVLGTGQLFPGDRFFQVMTARETGEHRVVVTRMGPEGTTSYAFRILRVQPAPERAPPQFAIGDTVATESLEHETDIDEFSFDGVAGQQVVVYVERLGSDRGILSAWMTQPNGYLAGGSFYASRGASTFERSALERIALPVTGRYTLHVDTRDDSSYAGPYRFVVREVRPQVERVAATLVPGDTLVGESVDHVGDVDEFTLEAPPGALVNVFAQAQAASHPLVVVARDAAGLALRTMSALPGEPLLDGPLGVVTMPASGRLRVRVADPSALWDSYTGPYRLFAFRADVGLEGVAPVTATGATIIQGAIDVRGDIDDFDFVVGAGRLLGLRVLPTAPGGAPAPVDLTLDGVPYPGFDAGKAAQVPAARGSHRLRVTTAGNGLRGTYRGPYRIVLALPDSTNEAAAVALAVNDSTRGEGASWPVDMDQYSVTATQVDTIVMRLVPATIDTANHWALTVHAFHGVLPVVQVDSVTGVQRTRRMVLRGAGDRLGMHVGSDTSRAEPGPAAPYTLAIQRVTAAPEQRSASATVGELIKEALDFSGDLDDFLVRGTPGTVVYVAGQSLANMTPAYPLLLDPASGALLAQGVFSYGPADVDSLPASAYASLPVTIPAGGVLRLRVCASFEPTCAAVHHLPGAYAVVVKAVNPAPEIVAAAIAVGDTIAAETLDSQSDVDEFTFQGAAGQRVELRAGIYDGTQDFPSAGMDFVLVNDATGTELGRVTPTWEAPLDRFVMPAVTLPQAGTYRVRVRGHFDANMMRLAGRYQFKLVPVP